jgi:hypothetical protein
MYTGFKASSNLYGVEIACFGFIRPPKNLCGPTKVLEAVLKTLALMQLHLFNF